MFELSLAELLLIAVAGIIIIGPRDLPKAIRAVMGVWKQFQAALSDIRRSMHDFVDESGVKDIKGEVEYILDQQGNLQPTYDISDLLPQPAITDRSESEEKASHEPAKPA